MKQLSNLPKVSQASHWQSQNPNTNLSNSRTHVLSTNLVAFWGDKSGMLGPAWSFTVSARMAAVPWREGPYEGEGVVSACYGLAGDGSVPTKRMKTPHAQAHL